MIELINIKLMHIVLCILHVDCKASRKLKLINISILQYG